MTSTAFRRVDCGAGGSAWGPAGTGAGAAVGADSIRVATIERCFGVKSGNGRMAGADLHGFVRPGRIIAVVGPSGSGKSTALTRLREALPAILDVGQMTFPAGAVLVDAVAPQAGLTEALGILNLCGLGEVRLWLRRYEELSEGERFRARLARAVAAAAVGAPGAGILVDEFACGLHRRMARSVACNLRKLASRRRMPIVVATPHEDVLVDLQPDVVVTLDDTGEAAISLRIPRRRAPSLWRRLQVVRGSRADYAAFAAMHYRSADELGFVDSIYCLRDGATGPVLGVVVYCHAPAELALRNRATGGRYQGRLALLNRDVRILRRLVIHPDLRGTGIAHRFVRRTLPLVGTPLVECLATMGAFNPVFERAGMRRIGRCALPPGQERLLTQLSDLDVDPYSADLAVQIARRPQVRAIIVKLVTEWYEATSGAGADRAARQTPTQLARLARGLAGSRPEYFLWRRRREPSARILSLASTHRAAPTPCTGGPARSAARGFAGLLPPGSSRRDAG